MRDRVTMRRQQRKGEKQVPPLGLKSSVGMTIVNFYHGLESGTEAPLYRT